MDEIRGLSSAAVDDGREEDGERKKSNVRGKAGVMQSHERLQEDRICKG